MLWEKDIFAKAHLGSRVTLITSGRFPVPEGLPNPYRIVDHVGPHKISRIQFLGLNVNIGLEGFPMDMLFSSTHFNLLKD